MSAFFDVTCFLLLCVCVYAHLTMWRLFVVSRTDR